MQLHRLLLLLVLVTACGGAPMTTAEEPVALGGDTDLSAAETAEEPRADPAGVAREFWAHLSSRDFHAAIAQASFPFDLDAHDGCIDAAEELAEALADDFPSPAAVLVVGEAHPISTDMDLSELHEHWHERIPRWTSPEASCLGAEQIGASEVEHLYFLVDFTFDGNEVGALTRVRCASGRCTVAGTDN